MAPSTSTGCDGICLSKSTASKLADESVKWEDREKPIGIRFKPSDEALARIFVGKAFGCTDNIVSQFIKEINVYEREPRDLLGSAHPFGEGKMYFFTHIEKKYSEGKTIKREVSEAGLWKKTGPISFIHPMHNDKKRSVKKTSLAFYKKIGGKSGQEKKTPWLMKEYTFECKNSKNSGKYLLALCVIYFKSDGKQQKLGESENESRDGRSEKSSMPVPDHMEAGSSQVATTTASSSFFSATQSYLNLPVSNRQPYPTPNNPETTLEHQIFFDPNYQNAGMASQAASYPNVYNDPNIYNPSSFSEPVPNDLVFNNLHIEPQPGPNEYSNLSVVPESNAIVTTNLFDKNVHLDPCLDSIAKFNCILRDLSPDYFAGLLSNDDRLQHFHNYDYGSNQQQLESSHFPIDRIVEQPTDLPMTWSPSEEQPVGMTPIAARSFHQSPLFADVSDGPNDQTTQQASDSVMACNPCEQQLVGMTPIAARPFYQSPLFANVSDEPNDQITQQASDSVMACNPCEQQPAGITPIAAQPFHQPFLIVNNGLLHDSDSAMTWNQSQQQFSPMHQFTTIEDQFFLCGYEPMREFQSYS